MQWRTKNCLGTCHLPRSLPYSLLFFLTFTAWQFTWRLNKQNFSLRIAIYIAMHQLFSQKYVIWRTKKLPQGFPQDSPHSSLKRGTLCPLPLAAVENISEYNKCTDYTIYIGLIIFIKNCKRTLFAQTEFYTAKMFFQSIPIKLNKPALLIKIAEQCCTIFISFHITIAVFCILTHHILAYFRQFGKHFKEQLPL